MPPQPTTKGKKEVATTFLVPLPGVGGQGDSTSQGAQRGALHPGSCSFFLATFPHAAQLAGGGWRRVATADATEPQGGSARILGLVVLPGARGGSGARDGGAARTTAAHRLLPRS